MSRILKYLFLALFLPLLFLRAEDRPAQPNIIFIVGEDTGPELGCYGDALAVTPNLDRLASQGARFTRAFTHAPVCAPSRSGLITGQFPTTIGTQHMRSVLNRPPVTFTKLLRDAGNPVRLVHCYRILLLKVVAFGLKSRRV